eukprot:gene2792-3231_t
MELPESDLRKILVRLGGFHAEMSFLGAIGHLMADSGLRELLELIHAPNATDEQGVTASSAGDTTSEDIQIDRAESEICDARNVILEAPSLIKGAGDLLKGILDEKIVARDLCASNALKVISEQVKKGGKSAAEVSRTAALWVQYMEMIDLLRKFIKAERTSNWELHLQTLAKMIPYLAAAGHNLYVKCGHLYLQLMSDLPNKHPDVHRQFVAGYHSVRRSEQYWAGLPTDLIIEQVLMRSLKPVVGWQEEVACLRSSALFGCCPCQLALTLTEP